MPRSKKQKKRDEYTVVLEDIRDNFQTFGEAQELLVNKVTKIENKVDKLEKGIDFVSTEVRLIRRDLDSVKTETRLIRQDQVSRNEFDLVKKKVSRIEQKIVVG